MEPSVDVKQAQLVTCTVVCSKSGTVVDMQVFTTDCLGSLRSITRVIMSVRKSGGWGLSAANPQRV